MMNFSRANQDTIYPIMGNYCVRNDCTRIDLSTEVLMEGLPVNHLALHKLIPETLNQKKALAGYGGYREKRALYRMSSHFLGSHEARDIHLGIDLWVPEGTPVYAPVGGLIHSFAYNDAFLDYGHTLILEHFFEGKKFHTLYGHLGRSQWDSWVIGRHLEAGSLIGHVGKEDENGGWYPHLHFQVVIDIEGNQGDYPGVCSDREKEHFFANCPDPSSLIVFPD